MNNIYFYNTRIGRIAIADNERAIIRLAFIKGRNRYSSAEGQR